MLRPAVNSWEPYHLSERTAAKILGVSKTRARQVISSLLRDDYLTVVEKGTPSTRSRIATTYGRGQRMRLMGSANQPRHPLPNGGAA